MIINQISGSENLKQVLTEQDTLLAELEEALEGKANVPAINLDEELATQDDLITQIMTELEGKATGGTVEYSTCTLTLNKAQDIGNAIISAIFVENGEAVYKEIPFGEGLSPKIENIMIPQIFGVNLNTLRLTILPNSDSNVDDIASFNGTTYIHVSESKDYYVSAQYHDF